MLLQHTKLVSTLLKIVPHMVNHALPICYFVAISQPKPCPLLWENWSVWWEPNPRNQLGRLTLYRWVTDAFEIGRQEGTWTLTPLQATDFESVVAAITPLGVWKLVGVEGFEPPTTCAQGKRTTRLSNTPNEIEILEILEIRWDVLESNQPSHPY